MQKSLLMFLIISIFAGATVLFANFYTNAPSFQGYVSYSEKNVSLDLFVMSLCPYGIQAENEVLKLIQKHSEVDLKVYYIVGKENDSFRSLHGDQEVLEDMRQACLQEKDKSKFLSYLSCFNQGLFEGKNVESASSFCLEKLGAKKLVEECIQTEAKTILQKHYEAVQEKQVSASPTIFIQGQLYGGSRSAARLEFEICKYSNSTVCPKENEVKLYYISGNCTLCRTAIEIYKQILKENYFPNISFYEYPINYTFLSRHDIHALPVLFFDKDVEKSNFFKDINRYVMQIGDYYFLKTEPIYLYDRSFKNNSLKLFVMAYCPYGNMAEDSLKEIVSSFKELDIEIHYIVSKEGTSFSSLHGDEELKEDMRQLCIKKYYPEKLLNYIWCVNENYTDYGKCMRNLSISESKIQACLNSEGNSLLDEDYKLTLDLGVMASPTFLLNNQILFSSAVTPQQIQQYICTENRLDGCNVNVSSGNIQPRSGGSCG
ncbi:MAG: hypothetical protein QW735_01950 [archaeon]